MPPSSPGSLSKFWFPHVWIFGVLFIVASNAAAATDPAIVRSQNPVAQEVAPDQPASASPAPPSTYDKAIFQNLLPAAQLSFLRHFAGEPSNDLIRDKQFRKLLHAMIPDCMFHYGWDIMLPDAVDKVVMGSTEPVQIRDGRYLIVSGHSGPYLQGCGFMWIDLQVGIALGGFYFHPTNGEPTPTVTVFSRQVREDALKLSQLPPAFADDLSEWSADSRVPPVTTRYFIGGTNRKILLEHDEDYCASIRGNNAPTDECEQMNADAADLDLNAAYYLDQTNHATNGTAWMIVGPEQTSWIQFRDDTCRVRPDRLPCRIRLTREHIHVIINRHAVPVKPPLHK